MLRIASMLLICALLAGCGCLAPAPNSPSTCFGPGSALKGDKPDDAAEGTG